MWLNNAGVLESAISAAQVSDAIESFESGSLDSEWTRDRSEFQVFSTVAFDGTYSAGVEDTGATFDNEPVGTWEPSALKNDGKPTKVKFYFKETSNSSGHGLAAVDSNGDVLFGAGTSNPDWVISTGDQHGTIRSRSSTYNRWIFVEMTLDWSASPPTVSFFFEDKDDGTTSSVGTESMWEDSPIAALEVRHLNGNTNSSSRWWGPNSNSMEAWVDLLEINY